MVAMVFNSDADPHKPILTTSRNLRKLRVVESWLVPRCFQKCYDGMQLSASDLFEDEALGKEIAE